MAAPRISVVVSTHDRPQLLRRLLDGLRGQTLGPEHFEVFVVDDASPPSTAALLDSERDRGGIELRCVRHDRPLGPSAGRNTGWRAARAPLVAFTDDDCVPDARWLEALLGAAGSHPDTILQGRTEPDPRDGPQPNGLLVRTRSIDRLGPSYETCNMAYPRRVLQALDGFDEAFGPGEPGEDTDLAWRALGRGYEAVFVPEALVHHAVVSLSVPDTLRDALRWGECARLFARHPGTRTILYRRVFWNVWHYLLIRSILAFAGPAWLRRQLIAHHLRLQVARATGAGAGPLWALYLVAFDLVETAGMIRGAVRHRTPLL